MTVEHSDVLRPGAVVCAVKRLDLWVAITTNYGTIYFAGARTAEMLHCPRCHEQRMVEIIETAKVKKGFCPVCAYVWALPARSVASDSSVPAPPVGKAR